MVDSTNNIDPSTAPDPGTKTGFSGFVASTNGKIIIGAIAFVVVLLVLGGIVVVFVMGGLASSVFSQAAQSAQSATPATASKPASNTPSVVPSAPPETPVASTFTFRNVFAPSVAPTFPSTTSSTSSSSSSESSETAASTESNTILLLSISTVNGEKQATFSWNGVSYTVGEGQQVDSSPWKVITISSNSVLMLFGDTQVTLTLGEGISK